MIKMTKIIKPVENGYITSEYGKIRNGIVHKGYDIGCKIHPCYIRAICDCIVVNSGWSDTFGLRVWVKPTIKEIEKKYPFIVYAHLEKIIASPKQILKAGDVIGIMGNTGISRGVHLHIEARTTTDFKGVSIDIEEIPFLYNEVKK